MPQKYKVLPGKKPIAPPPSEAGPGSIPAPGSAAWRPIATAPKDGTKIDLWFEGEFPGRYTDCYWGKPDHSCGEMGQYCDSDWHSEGPGWVDGTFNEFICREPTHWLPLPTPPNNQVEPRL